MSALLRVSGLLLALSLFAAPALGADAPIPLGDTQDFLLFHDRGPVLLRLHVQIDGKSYGSAWEYYLDRLFTDLDRDGDGFLSKEEAARAPGAEFLQSFLQGGLNLEAALTTAPFDQLDADRDGRVSRHEFGAYYRRCGFDRVRVTVIPDRGEAAALTDALFHLLDRDRDGKLSKEELKGAVAALRKVDLNEDEWITPEELLAHNPLRSDTTRGKTPTLEEVGVVPVKEGRITEHLTAALRKRYPDLKSMDALLAHPPELELIVRLGALAANDVRADVFNPDRRLMPLAKTARRTTGAGLAVDAAGLALDVNASDSGGTVRGLHAFYRQQFDAADTEQRGSLDHKQVEDVPALAALFSLADRDGDLQLTRQEFDSFLDLHARGSIAFITLTVADESLGLFDLIDEHHDGRLSPRELFTAWDRLRGLDRDGDGKLSRDEFPRRLRIRLTQGKSAPRSATISRPTLAPNTPRGPAWFRKMDRNGDGYVSRREFLGPQELFDRLDVDGDGLISPEEAERFDALSKPSPK